MLLPPKDFITTKEAAKISGYSPDYIARLVRSGEIVGRRVGHAWFVEASSLERFSSGQESRNNERSRALAQKRALEYHSSRPQTNVAAQATPTVITTAPVSMRAIASTPVQASTLSPAASTQPPLFRRSIRDASFMRKALALPIAFIVVTMSAWAAETIIPSIASHAVALGEQTASGFEAMAGNIPADVTSRLRAMRDTTVSSHGRVARDMARVIERSAQLTIPDLAGVMTPASIGTGTVRATHALIESETRFVYALSALGPESARIATTAIGTVGLSAARLVMAAPSVAANTASDAGARFFAAAADVSRQTLALAGNLGSSIPRAPSPHTFVPDASNIAAVAATTLSLGERTALYTYTTIHNLFGSAAQYLAGLFAPTPVYIPTPVRVPAPTIVIATSSAPVRTTVSPQVVYSSPNYYSNPSYSNITQGITKATLDQSLTALRLNLIDVIGRSGPTRPPSSLADVTADTLSLSDALVVASGGTGVATFSEGWLHSAGGTAALTSSTSPTINYFTATSILTASTFPYASSTALTVSGTASTTNLIVSSAGGTAGCASFAADGTITNVGTACGSGSGGGALPLANTG